MIKRLEYIEQLRAWKDKDVIKVVTGIRRCGKSTLLKLFQNELMESGIEEEQILSINFEDLQYADLLDYQKLYQYIKAKIQDEKTLYLFLDEVQNVVHYEKVVDSFYASKGVDIYLTGSNSYMFSGQLATYLSGRYIEISMLPLSFKEVYSSKTEDKYTAFREYMHVGGFPYVHQMEMLDDQLHMCMEGIYHTVVLKDIEDRFLRKELVGSSQNVHDVVLLNAIAKYLSSVIGSPVSIRNIANYFKSNERKVSPTTISAYVGALCDAFVYYPVEAMDVNGKELLKTNKKYYIVDMGIRDLILPKKQYDLGFTVENIVYLELRRRGYMVHVGKLKDTEVDFITKKHGVYTYYQVTASMMEESTFEREMKPLRAIQDNYDKIVLTLDSFSIGNYNGIKVINVIDWLLA